MTGFGKKRGRSGGTTGATTRGNDAAANDPQTGRDLGDGSTHTPPTAAHPRRAAGRAAAANPRQAVSGPGIYGGKPLVVTVPQEVLGKARDAAAALVGVSARAGGSPQVPLPGAITGQAHRTSDVGEGRCKSLKLAARIQCF